ALDEAHVAARPRHVLFRQNDADFLRAYRKIVVIELEHRRLPARTAICSSALDHTSIDRRGGRIPQEPPAPPLYLEVASGSIPLRLIVSEARGEERNAISCREAPIAFEPATTAAAKTWTN